MAVFEFLALYPVAFVATVFILGLIVGSFLNVVVYRLPLMLQAEWRQECRALLEQAEPAEPARRLNLMWPPSRCPHCERPIRAWENIPVVSYLALRGKCAGCRKPISRRYPLVELATGVLSAVVAWHFGFGLAAGAALLLTWALIALSLIDFDHQILPDNITLPFLWLGLLLSLGSTFSGALGGSVDATTSIIGAAAGYLSLWGVYQLFKLLTGKEGMGYGDFKLLALLGAWLGWQALPLVIILSSLVGAVVGFGLILALGRDRNLPIPFGPYLAAAGWIALLWGEPLSGLYLDFAGIR